MAYDSYGADFMNHLLSFFLFSLSFVPTGGDYMNSPAEDSLMNLACIICHVAESSGPLFTADLFPQDLLNLSCSVGLSSESLPSLSITVTRLKN